MKQILTRSRKVWWDGEYKGNIYRYPDGEVVCDDALNVLKAMREESADIVFFDPPFNLLPDCCLVSVI